MEWSVTFCDGLHQHRDWIPESGQPGSRSRLMSILLLGPVPELKSNDASISKYKHPPPYLPGPYTLNTPPETLPYLPSLPWFCITKLARFPEQVSTIGQYRLRYQPPASAESYDILLALVPSLSRPEFDWADVDPRLWATIVQVYR